MEVVYDDESLTSYMKAAVGVTPDRPILIDILEQMQKAVLPREHALLLLQKLQRFLFKSPAQQIVNIREVIIEMLPPHPAGIHDLRYSDPLQRFLDHELLQHTADGLTSDLGGFIPFSHLTAPFR